jgi:hypothetical protein
MRTNLFVTAAWLIASLALCGHSDAGVMVSIEPTPSGSPVILSAGETFSIDVLVSGLGDPGNPTSLDFLGVTISFDPNSFDALLSNFGLIVPNVAKGMIAFSPNSAIGQYDAGIPAIDPITDNGVFFTFSLMARNIATTTDSPISISDASYFAPDFADADRGNAIDARVLGGAVVPEPTSWAIFSAGAVCLAFARRRFS